MAHIKEFTVSRNANGPSYTLKLTVGSTPSDPAWADLNMTESDINDKAIQTVVIDLQSAIRREWPATLAEAQAFVDTWARGRKASHAVRVNAETAKTLKLSKTQIEGLKALGVRFDLGFEIGPTLS